MTFTAAHTRQLRASLLARDDVYGVRIKRNGEVHCKDVYDRWFFRGWENDLIENMLQDERFEAEFKAEADARQAEWERNVAR